MFGQLTVEMLTDPNGAKLTAVWDVFAPTKGLTKLLARSLASAVANRLPARPGGNTDRSLARSAWESVLERTVP